MLFRSDLDSYVKDVNTMMSEGYVTHNYYIEYSPCFSLRNKCPDVVIEKALKRALLHPVLLGYLYSLGSRKDGGSRLTIACC